MASVGIRIDDGGGRKEVFVVDSRRANRRAGAAIGGGIAGLVLGMLVGDPGSWVVVGALFGYLSSLGWRERARLDFTARWLQQAWRDGVIDDEAHKALSARLASSGVHVPPSMVVADMPAARVGSAAPRVTAPSPAAPASVPPSATGQSRPTRAAPATPTVARPDRPAATSPQVDRFAPLRAAWATLRSDVAVHGLTYLGVLLVFVAVLGFVVFAFSNVGTAWRPLAEASIPVVAFGAAAFLGARRAPFVASAMEALGGAVTPVVLFAAFVDGSALPPDLEGGALLVTLASASLALAGAYAFVARRRPASPLRHLAVPLVWVTVGVVGLVFEEGVSAAQFALIAAAVATTPFVGRHRDRGGGRYGDLGADLWPGALLLTYLVVIVLSGGEGWPVIPAAAAGAAVLVGSVRYAPARPYRWAVFTAVTAITAAVALATFEPGWVGLAVAGGFVALYEVGRRLGDEPPAAAPVYAAGIATGVVLAATGTWSLAATGLLITAWSHVARMRSLALPEGTVLGAVAAVAPALVLVGLGRELPSATVLWSSALLLMVASAAARVLERGRFYHRFVASWGVAAVAASAVVGEAGTWQAALAAVFAVTAIAVARIDGRLRVWISGPALVWAGHLGALWLPVAPRVEGVALAVASLSAVVGSGVLRKRPAGDVALVGHLAGIGALLVPVEGWWAVVTIGCVTAGWIVAAAASELGRSPLTVCEPHLAGSTVTPAAASLAAAGLLALSVAVAAAMGVPVDLELLVWVAGTAAVIYAVAGRVFVRRRYLCFVATIAAGFASVGSVIGVVLVPVSGWPAAGVLGLGIATAFALEPRRTGRMRGWYGWLLATPLVGVVGARLGATRPGMAWLLIGWGAAILLGGLVLDDLLAGRRPRGGSIRITWLLPPIFVGCVSVAMGASLGYLEPFRTTWPYAGAVGVVGFAAAFLSRNGWVSVISVLATVGGTWSALHGGPLDPVDAPWVLGVLAALFVAVRGGVVLGRVSVEAKDPWSLPAMVAAHAVAVTALVLAALEGSVAVTFTIVAVLAFAAAALERGWGWIAAGEALVLVASWDAGPWWLAATLGASAVAACAAAPLIRSVSKPLEWLAAAFSLAAVAQGLAAADTGRVVTGIVLAAVAALGAAGWAIAARIVVLSDDQLKRWAVPWLTMAALTTTGVAAWDLASFDRSVAAALAASFALWTFTLASLTAPRRPGTGTPSVEIDTIRDASGMVAAFGVGFFGIALDVSAVGWVALGVGFGVVATAVGLWLWSAGMDAWRRPVGLFTLLVQGGSAVAAIGVLPARPPLVVVLLSAAVQSLAAAIVGRWAPAAYAAPALATAAWLAFATESLAGDVEWLAVPVAASLLAMFDVFRWDRRRSDRRYPVEAVYGEYVAMGLFVGPALVDSVATSLGFVALVMALAVTLAIWGVATRVRRRVYGGMLAAVAGSVVVILVPLANLVPQFRGPALWLVLGALGVALIAAATLVEQGRRRMARVVASLDRLMDGWE